MISTLTELFVDASLLFFLGLCGWVLFSLLRLPVAPLIGSIAVIGTLRAAQIPLPFAPDFFSPLLQVVLGLFVGTKVTRETIRELKAMVSPALVIVAWSLSVVFLIGSFLSRVTYLDPFTAILSSSIGGLPEMTVIALAVDADIAVIILFQSVRMIATVALFPLIYKHWIMNDNYKRAGIDVNAGTYRWGKGWRLAGFRGITAVSPGYTAARIKERVTNLKSGFVSCQRNLPRLASSAGWGLISLGIASGGGFLFLMLGIPAGTMVGSMVFAAAASLLGVNIKPPPEKLFGVMLVGVGIMVSDNISAATLETIASGNILGPVMLLTLLIFLSSLLTAYIIHKVFRWDFPTSFLAASPAGFSVMVSLAIKYNKDPFRVSILHLCRLLAIKTVVPFVFMFYG